MPSVERELLLAEPVVARLTDERTAEGGPKLVITVGHNLRRNDGTATPAPPDDGADPDLAQWDWALADAIQVGGLGELTFDRLALNQPAGKPGFAFHYVLVRAQDSRIYAVSLYDVEDDRRAANGGELPKRTGRAIVEDRIRDRAPAKRRAGSEGERRDG
ncbi:MAG: hypothetical protein IBJ15_00240 [Alphaproteobacteria bacterium]|nr:hypothetical protein [Alphaproteobacteria bacterium]